MLQLQCVEMTDEENHLANFRFQLYVNGQPTSQYVTLLLSPDASEVGELYHLTADDYVEPGNNPTDKTIDKNRVFGK